MDKIGRDLAKKCTRIDRNRIALFQCVIDTLNLNMGNINSVFILIHVEVKKKKKKYFNQKVAVEDAVNFGPFFVEMPVLLRLVGENCHFDPILATHLYYW